MGALRLPLLCAFAGGCLSSAVLFGLWRADTSAAAPPAKQSAAPNVQLVVAVVPGLSSASLAGPSAEPSSASEPTAQATHAVEGGGAAPAGSAVSDVLMNLEAAYRARTAATDPAPAPATQERALAAAPSDNAVPPPPAAPPPQPVAAAIPVAPPAPAVVSPAVAAPAAAPPEIAAAPALVAQEDARPSEVHIGDVNQNTYITNVRQGDVYVQMQQLQVLQYMQLLGMSSGLAAPTTRRGRGTGSGARATPFSSTITNPDNPWGFHFSPPNLVH